MNRKNGLRQNFIKKGGFIATYDKKLLWRANLYIDEGANDWNDLNPWTSAQGNEWDNGSGSFKGGQCIRIQPWTHWDRGHEPQGTIYNTIAYNMGGNDSVITFNNKMEYQGRAQTEYYNMTSDRDNPGLAKENDWNQYYGLGDWEEIYKKFDDWMKEKSKEYYYNYFDNPDFILQNPAIIFTNYNKAKTEIVNDYMKERRAEWANYRPYIPGLCIYAHVKGDVTYKLKSGESDPVAITEKAYRDLAWQTVYGAGTECSGFVQRAAGYDGNPYLPGWGIANDNNDFDLTKVHNYASSVSFSDKKTWLIKSETLDNEFKTYFEGNNAPSYNGIPLVPGDVVYWSGSMGGHIVMILAIKYSKNREYTSKDIILIEAGSGWQTLGKGPTHAVINRQTMYIYQTAIAAYYDHKYKFRYARAIIKR